MADINKFVVKLKDREISVLEIHEILKDQKRLGTKADLEDALIQIIEQSQKICGVFSHDMHGFQVLTRSSDEIKIALIAAEKLVPGRVPDMRELHNTMCKHSSYYEHYHCRVYIDTCTPQISWDLEKHKSFHHLKVVSADEVAKTLDIGLADWDKMFNNEQVTKDGESK